MLTGRYQVPHLSPHEILELRNAGKGSGITTNQGLTPSDVMSVFQQCGINAEAINVSNSEHFESYLYSYMGLGLPIYLVCKLEQVGLHSTAILGYSMDKSRKGISRLLSVKSIGLKGSRIRSLVVHDSAIGPFTNLDIVEKKSGQPRHMKGMWQHANNKPVDITPEMIIVPLPQAVRLDYNSILLWVNRLSIIVDLFLKTDEKLEWDIQVVDSNAYKSSIRYSDQIDEKDKLEILVNQHPKFIWTVKLILKEVELIEFLADASNPKNTVPFYKVVKYNADFSSALNSLLRLEDSDPQLKSILTESLLSFLIKNT